MHVESLAGKNKIQNVLNSMMPCFALILGEHIENAAFTTAAAAMAISNCAHDINLVSSEDTLAAVHMGTVKLE